MKAVYFHQPVQGNDMALIASGIARKMASAGLLMALAATLSACGGGGDETEKPPVRSNTSSGHNALSQNLDGYTGTNPLASDSSVTGKALIDQLANGCRELHNTYGQRGHMACAAGTYVGKDMLTGKACSTILTANGEVSFVNGGQSWKTFSLQEDFFYHKSGSGKVWVMTLFAQDAERLLRKLRRASFRLDVDTRTGKYIDITQKNSDPEIGPDLNSTCRTTF